MKKFFSFFIIIIFFIDIPLSFLSNNQKNDSSYKILNQNEKYSSKTIGASFEYDYVFNTAKAFEYYLYKISVGDLNKIFDLTTHCLNDNSIYYDDDEQAKLNFYLAVISISYGPYVQNSNNYDVYFFTKSFSYWINNINMKSTTLKWDAFNYFFKNIYPKLIKGRDLTNLSFEWFKSKLDAIDYTNAPKLNFFYTNDSIIYDSKILGYNSNNDLMNEFKNLSTEITKYLLNYTLEGRSDKKNNQSKFDNACDEWVNGDEGAWNNFLESKPWIVNLIASNVNASSASSFIKKEGNFSDFTSMGMFYKKMSKNVAGNSQSGVNYDIGSNITLNESIISAAYDNKWSKLQLNDFEQIILNSINYMHYMNDNSYSVDSSLYHFVLTPDQWSNQYYSQYYNVFSDNWLSDGTFFSFRAFSTIINVNQLDNNLDDATLNNNFNNFSLSCKTWLAPIGEIFGFWSIYFMGLNKNFYKNLQNIYKNFVNKGTSNTPSARFPGIKLYGYGEYDFYIKGMKYYFDSSKIITLTIFIVIPILFIVIVGTLILLVRKKEELV